MSKLQIAASWAQILLAVVVIVALVSFGLWTFSRNRREAEIECLMSHSAISQYASAWRQLTGTPLPLEELRREGRERGVCQQ